MYYSTILSFVASTEQKAAAMATLYVLFQPVIVVNMSQNVTEFSLAESCPFLSQCTRHTLLVSIVKSVNSFYPTSNPSIPKNHRFLLLPSQVGRSLFLIVLNPVFWKQCVIKTPQQPGTPNLLPKALLLSLASYDTRNQIANKGTQKP